MEGESLFTYPDGQTYLNYSHPDHIPVFPDEAIDKATDEVLAACGTNKECIFDAVETGDISVGVETMATIVVNLDDEAQACENPSVCAKLYVKYNDVISFHSKLSSHYCRSKHTFCDSLTRGSPELQCH